MNLNLSKSNIYKYLKIRPRIYQSKNLLRYRISSRKKFLKYKPIYLFMAITDRCSVKCHMCQAQSSALSSFDMRHRPLPDMSFVTFKDIVDQYKEAVNISLVGSGEPLLNNDFFEMAKYAKTVRRARVTTLSNGFFNEKIMRQLLQGDLDTISISIKGFDQEDFHRLTGIGKIVFEEIINNIKKLNSMRQELKSQLELYGSFIVDKQNYQNITEMIDLAQNIGLDKVKFDTFLPYPFSGFSMNERCITSQDRDIIRYLRNINYNKYSIKIRPLTYLDLNNYNRVCLSPFTSMRIDSNGNVGGCNIKLLNLENNGKYSDPDVWNNEYFKNMRLFFINKEAQKISEDCLTCYEYSGKPIN